MTSQQYRYYIEVSEPPPPTPSASGDETSTVVGIESSINTRPHIASKSEILYRGNTHTHTHPNFNQQVNGYFRLENFEKKMLKCLDKSFLFLQSKPKHFRHIFTKKKSLKLQQTNCEFSDSIQKSCNKLQFSLLLLDGKALTIYRRGPAPMILIDVLIDISRQQKYNLQNKHTKRRRLLAGWGAGQ